MTNINIKNENSLELLKDIKSNSVDCIITDPPYNISQEGKDIGRKNLNSNSFKRNSNIKLDFGEWNKKTENDYYNFTKEWFNECTKILKPKGWVYIFFSKERIGYFTDPRNGLFVSNGIFVKTIISWHKTNPAPSFRKMNYLSSVEFIAVGSKGNSKIPNFLEQKNMHNFFETPNASIYGKTEHPTEKPLKLIKWLIEVGSNKNDTIFDPFMGSGTTGVASKLLHRNFIGFEIDKNYFKIAKERIDKTETMLEKNIINNYEVEE